MSHQGVVTHGELLEARKAIVQQDGGGGGGEAGRTGKHLSYRRHSNLMLRTLAICCASAGDNFRRPSSQALMVLR